MSGMTPEHFHRAFVTPDYLDWKKERVSIRRAFHVSVSAFHLADHYFRFRTQQDPIFASKFSKLSKLQERLATETLYFRAIQDMANAYKHLYTRAECSIASTGAIEELTVDDQEYQQTFENLNPEYIGDIKIIHRDGKVTIFSSAITAVMEMWGRIIWQRMPLT